MSHLLSDNDDPMHEGRWLGSEGYGSQTNAYVPTCPLGPALSFQSGEGVTTLNVVPHDAYGAEEVFLSMGLSTLANKYTDAYAPALARTPTGPVPGPRRGACSTGIASRPWSALRPGPGNTGMHQRNLTDPSKVGVLLNR